MTTQRALSLAAMIVLIMTAQLADAKVKSRVKHRSPPPPPVQKSEPILITPEPSQSEWGQPVRQESKLGAVQESPPREGLRHVNVRYQVPGIVANSHTFEADVAITQRLSIGPSVNYTRNVSNGDISLEYVRRYIGVVGHFYFTGDFSSNGLYVKPYISFASVRGRPQDSARGALTKSENGIALGATAGYQFIAPSGINIHIGAGFESRNYPDRADFRRSPSGEQIMLLSSNAFPLVGELSLGFAF